MKTLPPAKARNMVVQNLGKEILLYNLSNDKVYCLNQTLAIVYNACDGKTSFAELISKHNFTEDLIYFSLQQLEREDLVEGDYPNYFKKLSRREVIRRVGLSSILALPVISSLVAPLAAQAQSGGCLNQSCIFNNFTQSNCCNSLYRCSNSMSPNFCQECFSSNTRFFFAAPNATDTFCNTQPSKNLCCSAGAATGDGSWCYCP